MKLGNRDTEEEQDILELLETVFPVNPATEEHAMATDDADHQHLVRYLYFILYDWSGCKALLN